MEILSLTGSFGGNNADFNYVSLTYAFGTVRNARDEHSCIWDCPDRKINKDKV